MLNPCEKWKERVSAFVDDEVTLTERAQIEQHLRICPACRAYAEVLRCDAQDVTAALRSHDASDNFADRVMAQVATTAIEPSEVIAEEVGGAILPKPEPPRRSFGLRFNKWVAVASVIAVVGVGSIFAITVARERSRQVACTPAQRRIAESITMASQENEEMSPGSPMKSDKSRIEDGNLSRFDAGALYTDPIDGYYTDPIDGYEYSPTIAPPKLNYGLAEKLQIAYTASMGLESEQVDRTLERTELLFRQYDGFVLNSEFSQPQGGGVATGTVSGRVPAEKLGELLIALGKLGRITARSVIGEDLTAQQIEQWGRLQDLVGTQGNLSRIEGKARVTTGALQAESQRHDAAQNATSTRVEQYNLKSRVTLASVTVTITGKPKTVVKKVENPYAKSASGSIKAMQGFGRWLLTVIIPLLIWSPVWGALLGVTLYFRRKHFLRADKPSMDREAE